MSEAMLFTSESVSEGHPDKISDQISDAIVDAIIGQDPNARIAVETLTKTGLALVAGEVKYDKDKVRLETEEIVRGVIKDIGYDDSEMGFDYRSCAVLDAIGQQSSDINQGVDRGDPKDQ